MSPILLLLSSLTHPDKILYPKIGLSKRGLAEYYLAIQEWIMPYLNLRPLSIVRCPSGQTGECFFQKHLGEDLKSVYSMMIQEKFKKNSYAYIKDIGGLISLVQLGALEIHAWDCRIDRIEKPDGVILDLDPAPGVEWKKVVRCAFTIKEKLEMMGLHSFVKTTGGKGLHVVVPIVRYSSWEDIISFSSTLANELVLEHPKEMIATMSKAKREGKIFIDYLRNHRGATAVVPYSTRKTPNATVSVPLGWHELSARLHPEQFTVQTVIKRLAKIPEDPWAGFFKVKQKLKK